MRGFVVIQKSIYITRFWNYIWIRKNPREWRRMIDRKLMRKRYFISWYRKISWLRGSQPLNGKKVQHMDTILSVSTVLVPSTRWEAQKSCSIVPLVGLGGLSKRFVATGFLTWRHALLSSIFCKKCAKYEIQKDDVNVTTVAFEISRFCIQPRGKQSIITKACSRNLKRIDEVYRRNRGLKVGLLDTPIV